jgi:DNA-binding transcriptional LysR family regulator
VFYYVYREGGFHAAARAMRIGQSTISTTLATLEAQIGAKLFTRRPHAPLPLAREIYPQIAPVFDLIAQFRAGVYRWKGETLRIGASEFVLREYVLPLLKIILGENPKLRIVLEAGNREQVEGWLRDKKIDLALLVVDEPPTEFTWRPMLELPLVMLVPEASGITDVESLWANHAPKERLICPPPGEGVSRLFNRGVQQRGVAWAVTVQVGSTALMPWSVVAGLGMGPCVGVSSLTGVRGIRALPLKGFGKVTVGVAWVGEASATIEMFVKLTSAGARQLVAARKRAG